MRLALIGWTCWLLNVLRIPGFVAPGSYDARTTQARIEVRLGRFYTIITVNGLDIYFDRLTGRIDGIGFSPASGCIPDQALELKRPVGRLSNRRPPIRRGSSSEPNA